MRLEKIVLTRQVGHRASGLYSLQVSWQMLGTGFSRDSNADCARLLRLKGFLQTEAT